MRFNDVKLQKLNDAIQGVKGTQKDIIHRLRCIEHCLGLDITREFAETMTGIVMKVAAKMTRQEREERLAKIKERLDKSK